MPTEILVSKKPYLQSAPVQASLDSALSASRVMVSVSCSTQRERERVHRRRPVELKQELCERTSLISSGSLCFLLSALCQLSNSAQDLQNRLWDSLIGHTTCSLKAISLRAEKSLGEAAQCWAWGRLAVGLTPFSTGQPQPNQVTYWCFIFSLWRT